MESVINGLREGYEAILWAINSGMALVFFVLVFVAGALAVAMLVDVITTSSENFEKAGRLASPTAGSMLLTQVAAVAALIGAAVLFSRDSASFWQPWAALLGGVALLAIAFTHNERADPSPGRSRLVWFALAITACVACALAWAGRNDSLIPYVMLCATAIAYARNWFLLARPELVFDPSTVVPVKPSSEPRHLVAESLGMVYELPDGGSVEALKDVSFDLEPGRLLTLLGPSGCGKTTLLNILAGFLAPTSGVVLLGADEITGPGQDRGMVFQKGALFEWLSVNDNVGFGARMNGRSRPGSREEVQGLLQTVGLQGFGEKAVYELSGGMQQRVALARCLANDPDLILMDEPLGALDALTREKMQGLVLDLWKSTGKTIVLVTHSVEEALYLGDKLFVMAPRPGRIERTYDLPFAHQALTTDARELKASKEFIAMREEILSLIWEMEEEIMGGTDQ